MSLISGYKGSSCFNTSLAKILYETGDREGLSTICCHLEEKLRDPSGKSMQVIRKFQAHTDGLEVCKLGPRAVDLYKEDEE